MLKIPKLLALSNETGRISRSIELGVRSGLRRGNVDHEPDLTLRSFVGSVNARFEWYRHCCVLENVLEKVVAGEIKRLMVFMPPRHGKSELISRMFPAYYLRKHPHRWVGMASHTADLSYGFSRNARDAYARQASLRSDVAAVKQWETGRGGGMWAAGVGGSITGKGFHLGIIDDPIKNADEARSETVRMGQKNWYSSTFYTREEPEGCIVIVQTRWNEDDLAGWLLTEENEDELPEHWHIVNFEAVKEEEQLKFPSTCTLEPDWRQPGEALCPERYDADKLQKIRKRLRSYFWFSLYQQRPRPKEGDICKREWLQIVEESPFPANEPPTAVCRFWDKAATNNDGDFTVGCQGFKHEEVIYIENILRGQWSSGARDKIIKQQASVDRHKYGDCVVIGTEQEGGSAGVDAVVAFQAMLSKYCVEIRLPRGKKESRWDPFLAALENGRVKLMKGDWNADFIDEMCDVPYGKYDDQVDAASQMWAILAGDDDLPPAEVF